MNRNKFLALAMAGAMTLAAATPVFADETSQSVNGTATTAAKGTTTVNLAVAETTYELVVPATLDVKGSGYNAFSDGVTVKNLTNGDGVTSIDVTAESTNGWSLKGSDENAISYMLVENEESDTAKTTYSFTDKTAMAETTGETIACGVNVSDYSSAAVGNYSDTITWTAEVKKTTTTEVILCDGSDGKAYETWYGKKYGYGQLSSSTTDGVTYACESLDISNYGFKNGTFSTSEGVITKIVISSECTINATGTGWTLKDGRTATWSGTKAASVDFTGNFYGDYLSVVVTVER